jgi:hypothetical protein
VGILGAIEYWRAGYVDVRLGLLLAVGILIGAFIGARVAIGLPNELIQRASVWSAGAGRSSFGTVGVMDLVRPGTRIVGAALHPRATSVDLGHHRDPTRGSGIPPYRM